MELQKVRSYYLKSAHKFNTFWMSYLEKNPDRNSILLEIDNLSLAFKKSIQYDMLPMAIRSHQVYDLFEAQGLHRQLKPVLNYIDNHAELIGSNDIWSKNHQLLGRIAFRLNDFEVARAHFLNGLAFAQQNDLDLMIGTFQYELANLAFEQHHYQEALDYLTSALARAKRLKDHISYCHYLSSLAQINYFQGNHEAALAICNEGVPLAKEYAQYSAVAMFLTCLGSIKMAEKDFDQAIAYMIDGLDNARKSENVDRVLNLLTNLGSVEAERSNSLTAKKYLDEALQIARNLGFTGYIIHILVDLGQIRCQLGETEEGLAQFNESVDQAYDFDDWSLTLYVLNKRADYYLEQGEPALAIADLEKMLLINTPDNERVKRHLAQFNWKLAKAYVSLDRCEEALSPAQKSQALFKQIDSPLQFEVEAWLGSIIQ